MSREAFGRIVQAYENFDAGSMYSDQVCLPTVSKLIRGRSRVEREDKQQCPDGCVTLKRLGEFEIEIVSGPCDSEVSKATLDGEMRGELVAAYAGGDPDARGGISSRFKWAGAGSSVVGRTLAVTNAGTHHDPLRDCEKCDQPHHAEGWLRGAIVDGQNEGARVNGALSYNVDPGDGGASFIGVFEGLLIVQCSD